MKKIIALTIIFIAAIIAIVVAFTAISSPKSATGTYCTGSGMSEDDLYIAIFSDDSYMIYKQFEEISSGSYTEENMKNASVLTFKEQDDTKYIAIFDGKDNISLIDASDIDNKISFIRLNSTPTLINIHTNNN